LTASKRDPTCLWYSKAYKSDCTATVICNCRAYLQSLPVSYSRFSLVHNHEQLANMIKRSSLFWRVAIIGSLLVAANYYFFFDFEGVVTHSLKSSAERRNPFSVQNSTTSVKSETRPPKTDEATPPSTARPSISVQRDKFVLGGLDFDKVRPMESEVIKIGSWNDPPEHTTIVSTYFDFSNNSTKSHPNWQVNRSNL
jgi:hypothetical protein